MRSIKKAASAALAAALALGITSCAESERGEGGESSGDGTFTFGVSQIPYAKYDVIAYFDEYESSVAALDFSISDGTTTYYTRTTQAARFTGTHVRVTSTDSGSPQTTGDYVQFEGLTAASVTITIDNLTSVARHLVPTGIQLIERTDA